MMSHDNDEIDIEEHDVLDDPHIREIFPNIEAIKKEIQRDYDEGLKSVPVTDPLNNIVPGIRDTETNRLLINADLKVEQLVTSDNLENNFKKTESSEKRFNRNKIIIGSKPSKKFEYEDFFKQQLISNSVVELRDLGPYLEKCQRYCPECLILFPKKSLLTTHNNTTHSPVKKSQSKDTCNDKQTGILINKASCSADSISLKRRQENVREKKIATKRIKKVNAQSSQQSDQKFSNENSKCDHCGKIFSCKESLIEHMYNILWSKSKSPTKIKKVHKNVITNKKDSTVDEEMTDEKRKQLRTKTDSEIELSEGKLFYRCYVCSYYFRNIKFYTTHLETKHNVTDDKITIEIPQKFNPKCRYCSVKLSNMFSYNSHMHHNHKEKYCTKKVISTKTPSVIRPTTSDIKKLVETKQDDLPILNQVVLKSILFKCNKCDIHFLSAEAATSHLEHMELLINWKCLKCNSIFKKNDEMLHLKQHSDNDTFMVYDLDPSDFPRLLYCCTRCTVHFTEDNILSHCATCLSETPSSIYCKICDILIHKRSSKAHELCHSQDNLQPNDFVIIESDYILGVESLNAKNVTKIVKNNSGNKLLYDGKSKNDKDNTLENGNRFKMKKCKKIKRKDCKKISRKSKVSSQYRKNEWFNFSYCSTCKCFIRIVNGKMAVHLEFKCSHLIKYVCKICGLVVTAKSYQSHKMLHVENPNLKLHNFTFTDIHDRQRICPPIPEYPKCKHCEVHFVTKMDSAMTHLCSDRDYLTCHICDIKLSEEAFKLHMGFHNYTIGNKLKSGLNNKSPRNVTIASSEILDSITVIQNSEGQYVSNIQQNNSNNNDTAIQHNTLQESTIIYCCKNCNVTVDSYDKVVEHCQDHYSRQKCRLKIETCEICDLKFDSTCYIDHRKLHSNQTQPIFRKIDFDTFYFTSDNNVWLNHVFKSFSDKEISEIVNKSIYKVECRIKMEVIQNGSPHLTVYKCDRCCCFISNKSIYRHAENSCFKLRKHPCSFCGLPFISSILRVQHEKIHKTPDIGIKSYRIVVFNKEKDRTLNKELSCRQHYALYQCRNCDTIIDKYQMSQHICNEDVRKCSECGLVIRKIEFDTHVQRHKELTNFNEDNIKVILFGDMIDSSKNCKILTSSFGGIVSDYTFYKCVNCQISVRNDKSKHTCATGALRFLCPICNLYISANKLKEHKKLHDVDPDFLKENIRICELDMRNIESKDNDTEPDNNQTLRNDVNVSVKDLVAFSSLNKNDTAIENSLQKVAKIYKCKCGLNFLDEKTITTHMEICNPKIRASKQKCSKCNILFTPNILFTHLLIHHGNKEINFKFDIVEMGKSNVETVPNEDDSETNSSEETALESVIHVKEYDKRIYRCNKCFLHFLTKASIVLHHSEKHETLAKIQDICNICGLNFVSSVLPKHINIHHKQFNLKYDDFIIIDL